MDASTRKALIHVAVTAQFLADDIDPEKLWCFGNADDFRQTVMLHDKRVITRLDARQLLMALAPIFPHPIVGGGPAILKLLLANTAIPSNVLEPFSRLVLALNGLSLGTPQPAEKINAKLVAELRSSGERMQEVLTFVPTERQREILEALNGHKKTQLQLMTELDIGSKETFNGKNGVGGIKELIDCGLVAKDGHKAGGYFRPDAPPK